MQYRRLSVINNEAVQKMDTGIENDYVKRIFPALAESEILYGAFEKDQLVSIAGCTLFASHYAVLGRLRTDQRYRGNGISTQLLRSMLQEIEQLPQVHWIGLATQEDNPAVHRISDSLDLDLLSTFHSCVLNEEGMLALKKEKVQKEETWVEVFCNKAKKDLIKRLISEENSLNMFPYACYYPLPYYEDLLDDQYLSNCKFWEKGNRFVSLMPDEKGDSYYQMKYFWNDSFDQEGLWPKMIQEAEKEGRKIWIDLSPEGFNRIPNLSYFNLSSAWRLYGKRIDKRELGNISL